jgi:ABC-2 type transport system ATP-binding protein
MPEERGLYQDLPLDRVLTYLAALKGMTTTEIHARLDDYLTRFDLAQHRHKKVKELSKGMQQKAQIIATIIHRPELLIIDEPFSGLDPVNTQMAIDLLTELRGQGTTVIMSTHIKHQVEELCNRIVLINQGRNVLYGDLAQIQREYSGHAVRVKVAGELPQRDAPRLARFFTEQLAQRGGSVGGGAVCCLGFSRCIAASPSSSTGGRPSVAMRL